MSLDDRTMDVADAVRALRPHGDGAIAVVTMSAIAFWEDPEPRHFRLLGTMGAAASIGLGLALGAPDEEVWVVDGDGSLLMQLAVVAAVGGVRPPNLRHVVVDNGMYAISGGQPMPVPADWPGLLRAAGYSDVATCATPAAVAAAAARDVPGPAAIILRCRSERPAYAPGALRVSPAEEAARLRAALTREPA
jgi:phosphonopyruvate decarboxylase